MVAHGTNLPAKLKHDAIVESLLDIRFEPVAMLPEVFLGRLADHQAWRGFTQNRLPAYNLPEPLRQAEPNLRYTPVIALVAPDNQSSVRLGPQVLSFHRLTPYPGWARFRPELHEAIDALFSTIDGLTVNRLGLRYINALTATVHEIKSVRDLDLQIQIARDPLFGNLGFNFTTDISADTQCIVKIATTEHVLGLVPKDTSVVIDVDVFTKTPGFTTNDKDVVKKWLDFAHTKEKEQFFHLLTQKTIDFLQEE